MPIDYQRFEVRAPGGASVGVACGDGRAVVVRTWAALPENSSLTMRPVDDARWQQLHSEHPATYQNGGAKQAGNRGGA